VSASEGLLQQLVRHFPENGFKFLLREPGNLRDLLMMQDRQRAVRIDYSSMTVQPATFIAPDFRHLESDLLLRAPLLDAQGRRLETAIEVYILIEHQSEPEELATFQLLRYGVQVYDAQLRGWEREHRTRKGFRFQPVLPVLFYSGTRSWPRLPAMKELVHQGALFAPMLPQLRPLFFNLSSQTATALRRHGGVLGWVLHLVQQRHRPEPHFRELLGEVVARLEQLPSDQKGRWRDLLWYIHALVYHERERAEQPPLLDFIQKTVRATELQEEVTEMGKTIAESLREEGKLEGKLEGKRETLVRLLRTRFRNVPEKIVIQIQDTQDVAQLDTWLDAFASAKKLTDIFGRKG
jgi:predicted transposase YdaD